MTPSGRVVTRSAAPPAPAPVAPLKQAVDDIVTATELVDKNEPLTPERQLTKMTGLYRQLVSTLEEVLPLLGLVLFGDPQVAKKFYCEHFSVAMDRLAMDRLARAWREAEDRYGFPFESPDIAARAVMGRRCCWRWSASTARSSTGTVPYP